MHTARRTPGGGSGLAAGAVAATAAALFLSLLSRNYISDGVRWLPAVTGAAVPPGPARYLLYPALSWAWYHGWRALGWHGATIPLCQALNAVAAGLGVGLFFLLLERLSGRRWLAGWGAALLAGSGAWGLHATDMTEPMPGVVLLVATYLLADVAAERSHWGWQVAAVVTAALGVALNVATVVGWPGVGVLLYLRGRQRSWRPALWFWAASAVAAAGWMVAAEALLRGLTPVAAARTLVEEYGFYLDFLVLAPPRYAVSPLRSAISRVLYFVLGGAGALWGLREEEFYGLRDLLRGGVGARWNRLALGLGVLTAIALLGVVALRRSRRLRLDPMLVVGMVWALPAAAFTYLAGPTYPKFWMQVLPGGILVVSGLVEQAAAEWRPLRWCYGSFVVVLLGVNLVGNLWWRHATEPACAAEARQVAALLGPNDLLINISLDPVSYYVEAVFGRRRFNALDHYIIGLHMHNALMERDLRAAIAETIQRGGQVYWMGLEDLAPERWPNTDYARHGLPRSLFQVPVVPVLTLHCHPVPGHPQFSLYRQVAGR